MKTLNCKRKMGLVALLFAFFHISTLQAQTVTGQYVPGAMIDGAVYFLPKRLSALRYSLRSRPIPLATLPLTLNGISA